MTPAIRYERNSAGIEELLLSPRMGEHMEARARAGLAYFETIAPRRTHRYATSGRVSGGMDPYPSPRAVAHLAVDAEYAVFVEDRHRTLGRVVDFIEGGLG